MPEEPSAQGLVKHRRFHPARAGHAPAMTQAPAPQRREVERAKARMSTAVILMTTTVFAVIVLGIVLYLVFR
jgi:hypothetical protein